MSLLTRRALIAQTASMALAAPALAQPYGGGWNYDQYVAAMRASERRIGMNKGTFDGVMRRRDQAQRIVENYLRGKFREADAHSLRAYAEVPREYFHYNYAGPFDFGHSAYEGNAHPWAIGYGSALSDYLGQMYMTQLSKPQPGENALEIGTGSGYQISILSRVCAKAYSIEIIEPLGRAVAKIFKPLGFNNVITKVGDGYFGWPEETEGFDIIMVTCVAQHVPPPLLAQLKPGTGRLIIPVGQPFRREQVLYVYTKDRDGKIHSRRDVGVYFIPMTGRISRGR